MHSILNDIERIILITYCYSTEDTNDCKGGVDFACTLIKDITVTESDHVRIMALGVLL